MKLLSIFLLSFLSNFQSVHQFHLSKCLIEYNEKEKAIQVSMQLFLDDLEEALRREGKDKLFLCTKKEAEHAEAYMEEYLRQHFILTVNGEKMEYNFLGKELGSTPLAAWCYVEIENIDQLSSLEIDFDFLMEVFPDQKNVVQVIGPKRKKGTVLLQKGKTKERILF